MKYTEAQKKAIKDGHILNFKPPAKDIDQITLQEMINEHYPEPEKYQVYESKINTIEL